MTRLRLILLFLSFTAVYACTSMPGEQGAISSFIDTQKKLAQQYNDQGDLHRALTVWRTLLPLGKPDQQTSNAIGDLERRIAQKVLTSIKSGQGAYKRGEIRQGESYMLRALALQPGQESAKAALAKSFSDRARARQTSKNYPTEPKVPAQAVVETISRTEQLENLYAQKDYAGMLALKGQDSGLDNTRNDELLRLAHIEMANRYERRGDLDAALEHLQGAMIQKPLANDPLVDRSLKLRNKLSSRWYVEGSRLLKSDISKAIKALDRSLTYNPYNNNAKRKLSQARTLQRNLEKIEGN